MTGTVSTATSVTLTPGIVILHEIFKIRLLALVRTGIEPVRWPR